jgi:ABC-2 type transport system permease protein
MTELMLYCKYAAISIRGQMQYRASSIMASLGHLIQVGTEFLSVWALFDRFGNLQGWSLAEVSLFYGMINIAFSISEAAVHGFDTFPSMVKNGGFDRFLVRPRSTAVQVASREFQLVRVGRLAMGLVVLTIGAASLGQSWTLERLVIVLGAIAGGAFLFSGLAVLQATAAFWTTEGLEIAYTVTAGGVETARYPLALYRPWFRRFFTWVVPLAAVSYYPAMAILSRPDPLGSPPWFQKLAPLIGVAFFVISLQVWKIGVRHYRSTGS